jgi:hypothetical protein
MIAAQQQTRDDSCPERLASQSNRASSAYLTIRSLISA